MKWVCWFELILLFWIMYQDGLLFISLLFMPLLKSGFGVEASSSLHKLDVSVRKLKLYGYICGPNETFSVKAFQYFYINSRYISRGPIHKLLNQLAATHSCSDLLKADSRSYCGKRSRCQASPTYILNLTCPQAHYDLSFEPAKTCVEFKDWDSVFAFIKETISCFWSQGAHISEEDAIWNGADTSSTRNDPLNNGRPKKRCMTRLHQDSVVLSSPQMEMPREEPKQRHQDSFVLSSPQMEMPREEPKQRHQDSFVLSSPQLEMPREEPKHMPFSSYSCRRTQRNVKSEDYGNELDFAFLPDNPLQIRGSEAKS